MSKAKKSTIEYINDVDISLLRKKMQLMKDVNNVPYIMAYPYLIEFTSRQKEDIHSLISISHMVYGWMPTIIESSFCNNDLELWQNINEGSLESAFLFRMKECINNSIVGTSKFLHFKNPEQYAIWDSKVYMSITGLKNNQNQINNIDNYIAYIRRLRLLAERPEIDEMKNSLIKKGYCNFNDSKMRVIELILFYTHFPEYSD